jgi:hypothetical protein
MLGQRGALSPLALHHPETLHQLMDGLPSKAPGLFWWSIPFAGQAIGDLRGAASLLTIPISKVRVCSCGFLALPP